MRVMNEIKNSWELATIAVNQQILERRVTSFNAIKTIREGDYVRHLTGKMDRVTYVWPESAQTGGGQGSYYLGEGGYISYSGGLDPGTLLTKLVLTDEVKKGMIWFFSRDNHTAHNGIDFSIDFRVYNEIE
jgi:hypothetical protein